METEIKLLKFKKCTFYSKFEMVRKDNSEFKDNTIKTIQYEYREEKKRLKKKKQNLKDPWNNVKRIYIHVIEAAVGEEREKGTKTEFFKKMVKMFLDLMKKF